MNKYAILLPTAALLTLNGCLTMAPKYDRPEAPVPANWPEGAAYQNTPADDDAADAPAIAWQDFFTDPKLRAIIGMALENNRDLRLTALNVEKARALYGVQRAELFPAVNATGTGNRQQTSAHLTGEGIPRTTEQYGVNLGIAAWELDLFGRIRSLKEQALQEYLATGQARRGAQITLVSETALIYMKLAADLEKLDLARSTLEMQEHVHKLIQRRHEVEIAHEIDLRRTQTQVDAARVDVARGAQITAQDQNALNLLAGAPVPDDLLPADLAGITPPRALAAGVSSEALLNRPDIMAAEHQLRGAYAMIGAARAAFFPRIGLTTALGTASDQLSGLFKSDSGVWNFTPQITLPIFDARVWAARRVSKSAQKIALTRYEQAIQAAFREVADALAVRGTIDEQMAAQQAMVDAAQRIHFLSGQRYKNGIDSYLSVLDAQRSLYGAQQALITMRLAKLANDVKIYAVLGGGGELPETDNANGRDF